MKSREIWKKQHKNLYRFFSGKSLRRFFFMCFRMKTFQENEQIFFFFLLFKELRRHYIFMCETKWKKNNPYSFLGFFSGKHFRRIFYHLEKMCWKSFQLFPCETELKKKKSVSLFGRKLMGEFYYAELFLEKKKKTHPDFFPHVNPSEKQVFWRFFNFMCVTEWTDFFQENILVNRVKEWKNISFFLQNFFWKKLSLKMFFLYEI